MKKFSNTIKYGDKIFARLTMGQRTIVELMVNRVNSLSEVIAELRYTTRGLRGLATLHLRNQSQGWSTERPLMLYAGRPVRQSPANGGEGSLFLPADTSAYSPSAIFRHYNL